VHGRVAEYPDCEHICDVCGGGVCDHFLSCWACAYEPWKEDSGHYQSLGLRVSRAVTGAHERDDLVELEKVVFLGGEDGRIARMVIGALRDKIEYAAPAIYRSLLLAPSVTPVD